MKVKNYYQSELDTLKKFLPVSIQLVDADGNRTKWMDLNLESIPEIVKFLVEFEKGK